MAVAHDATSTRRDWAESNQTWTHTPVGTPNYVEIAVGWETTPTINTITYGGNAMTLVDSQNNNTDGVQCAIYGLVSPPSGAQTCQIIWSGNVNYAARCTSYTGVDTTTPRGTPVKQSFSAQTSSSLDAGAATGDLVSDVIVINNRTNTLTVGADQTQRSNETSNGGSPGVTGAGSTEAGATTTTMSWSISGSSNGAHVAAAIKASGGSTQSILPHISNYVF